MVINHDHDQDDDQNQDNSSTISSGLNSLAAIGLRDFLPTNTRSKMGESCQVLITVITMRRLPSRNIVTKHHDQALVTKLMALGFGCVGYALTFLIRVMPSMLEVNQKK